MNNSLVSGESYRLVKDVVIGKCVLQKGGVFSYSSGGYSPYDDGYIYHFIDLNGGEVVCFSQTELPFDDIKNFEIIRT